MNASMKTLIVVVVASILGETCRSASPSMMAITITPITLPPSVNGPRIDRGSFSRICKTLSCGCEFCAFSSAAEISEDNAAPSCSMLTRSSSLSPRRSPGLMRLATVRPMRIATMVLVASNLIKAAVLPFSILAPARACTIAKNATGAANIWTSPINTLPG